MREDYSEHGTAWEHLDHDQARSRTYRWNEDGLGGICDEGQTLCLAMALWNGRDPILKERAFGLTGNQGNHGEDVKEYYFYRDATPSHSYLNYLYKYPQAEYPYARLVEENARRGRHDPALSLLDTGVFAERRYWDLEVIYAKASPTEVHCRIYLHNRGSEAAEIHCLPTLWFRNTWSWSEEAGERPSMRSVEAPAGAAWAVSASHPDLGIYFLYGAQPAEPLFTDNESNRERIWGLPNANPFVKDAFHRRVVAGELAAVNPDRTGTKAAAWTRCIVAPGEQARIDLVLSASPLEQPFRQQEAVREFKRRGVVPGVSCAAGKILCMSSVHDVIPWAGHVNYAASKGGGTMMMKSIAQEVAPWRIRVNAISPGAIRTPINMEAWETPEAYAELLRLVPYKRIGEPEDIGRAAVWLASDYSDYISGICLYVDGGMTLYPGFETGG